MGARGWQAAVGAALVAALCGACGDLELGGHDDPSPSELSMTDELAGLTVRPPGTMDGYSRERFPHWSEQGGCDTRELVLKRSGEDVRTDDECYAVAGTWRSPYDGAEWTDASDVDIDHVVPLAEAWRSGARGWSDDRREAFANDLERPQLLAVTDEVNQAKGDSPPDEWKPERRSYWCAYAESWVAVKHHYKLSVTSDEKQALRDMLEPCKP